MKGIKNFFNNHLVLIAILFSIIYAIIVHFCFKIKCFPYFLTAEWSAGEILTYVSTLSLGLIALWQNKKLREENEKSQKRLEEINDKTNELIVVQKIIEIENEKLDRLRICIDDFSYYCDPQSIDSAINEASGDIDRRRKIIVDLIRNATDSFVSMERELWNDSEIILSDEVPIRRKQLDLYHSFREICDKVYDNLTDDIDSKLKTMVTLRNEFWQEKESYLFDQERKLKSLLYEDLTLDEIKKMYK